MLVLKVLVAAGRACTPGSSSTSEEGPGTDDDAAAEKAQREKEATFSCSASLPQGIRAVTREKIPIALRPKLWDKPHAESFWELFYDLIIVVAFIRISSGTGQEKGDSTSLQRGCSRSDFRDKSIHALSSPREMIARPKMSQIDWKPTEI